MPKRPTLRQAGFTLIELIIVIFIIVLLVVVLIIAIMSAMGASKEKATAANMAIIGDGIVHLITSDNDPAYYMLTGQMEGPFGPEAVSRFGLGSEVDRGIPSASTATSRSGLLVLALAPTPDALTINGEKIAWTPAISSDTARNMIDSSYEGASDKYPVFIDAWGNPITYRWEPDEAAITSDDKRTLQLMSAGPDGLYDTEEDNIYWNTATRRTWQGNENK